MCTTETTRQGVILVKAQSKVSLYLMVLSLNLMSVFCLCLLLLQKSFISHDLDAFFFYLPSFHYFFEIFHKFWFVSSPSCLTRRYLVWLTLFLFTLLYFLCNERSSSSKANVQTEIPWHYNEKIITINIFLLNVTVIS